MEPDHCATICPCGLIKNCVGTTRTLKADQAGAAPESRYTWVQPLAGSDVDKPID